MSKNLVALLAIISLCFISSSTGQSTGDPLDTTYNNCNKQFSEADDGTGLFDRCCVRWRITTCAVNTVGSLLRASTLDAMKIRMNQAGCDRYTRNIGDSMPAACYFKYRVWVPVIIGLCILVLIAVVAIGVVNVIKTQRRNRTAPINDIAMRT